MQHQTFILAYRLKASESLFSKRLYPKVSEQEKLYMKVLFINNYPMDKALDRWKRGEYPGHHLWGITHLHQYGIEVDILPYEQYSILNKIGEIFKLGSYLDQQLRILLQLSKYDLVYSACQENTFFLSILRNMGIFRKPIIAIVHHPIYKGRRSEIFVRGHDKLLCLSKSVLRKLEKEFSIGDEKAYTLDWGIDLPFYEKLTNNPTVGSDDSFIISAGKTERDHDTLAKAFFGIDYPLKIYCSDESAPSIPELPPNITVQFDQAISYLEVLTECKKAYAVAIPLKKNDSPIGLTSLLDAMAMQKAVIMTKNSRIHLDIEQEGIGIWVDPDDVEGWRHAVTYLLSHPEEAKQMGNRGYQLCQSKYNLDVFSSNLAKIFKSHVPH